jgi:uncharacterized protein (TIGR03437 family)
VKSVAPYAPAVFSVPENQSSSFRYAIALNQDGSLNSRQRPAAKGSIITLYLTGLGLTDPAGDDGALAGLAPKIPLQSLRVMIANQLAEMLYAGTAPSLVEGLTQVNVRIPSDVTGGTNRIEVQMGRGRVPQPPILIHTGF